MSHSKRGHVCKNLAFLCNIYVIYFSVYCINWLYPITLDLGGQNISTNFSEIQAQVYLLIVLNERHGTIHLFVLTIRFHYENLSSKSIIKTHFHVTLHFFFFYYELKRILKLGQNNFINIKITYYNYRIINQIININLNLVVDSNSICITFVFVYNNNR